MVNHVIKKSRFNATVDKGPVSAVLNLPKDANALLILAHGAGAGMLHHHMESITEALSRNKIATFRFNFPYMEAEGKRTDNMAICVETFANAVASIDKIAVKMPLFIGGHSFGGRMSSHFIAQEMPAQVCRGLIYFSFPLHPSKKPDIKRADHLAAIKTPMLFLSGTRDSLAEPKLLEQVTRNIPNAEIHWLDTADHGFKILKRTRESKEDVYDEAARTATTFIETQIRH